MKIIICDDDVNIIKQISFFLDTITKKRKLNFEISSYTCSNNVKQKKRKI